MRGRMVGAETRSEMEKHSERARDTMREQEIR